MPESTPPATSEPDGPGRSPPRLFEAAYDDLKRIAVGFCYRERADSTMQPTALVHEVYLRLINRRRPALARTQTLPRNRRPPHAPDADRSRALGTSAQAWW
jgi:hypothetical protein